MGAFVYILQCADDSYYVGSARGDDLDKRFYEHQTGRSAATRAPAGPCSSFSTSTSNA